MNNKLLKELIKCEMVLSRGNTVKDKLKTLIGYLDTPLVNGVTSPGPASFEIKSTTETAFQRAIFKSKSDLEGIGEIRWTDLEIPVVFSKKSRRPCVDLVGKTVEKTNCQGVLCELKFGDSSSTDSPIIAVLELLTYYFCIKNNLTHLINNKVHHSIEGKNNNWELFRKDPRLIVAANFSYWKYWENREKSNFWRNRFKSFMKKVVNLHNTPSVELYSLNDENFKAQKKQRDRYEPVLGKNASWKRVDVK